MTKNKCENQINDQLIHGLYLLSSAITKLAEQSTITIRGIVQKAKHD